MIAALLKMNPRAKLILITGGSFRLQFQSGGEADMQACLTKPFNLRHLLNAVQDVLQAA